MSKKWYASKTFWFGIATVLFGLLEKFGPQFGYTGVIPSEWGQYIVLLEGLLTIILRFATGTTIDGPVAGALRGDRR